MADCLTYLQNLIRPGGSEDAYALQCAQLRMVTPSGLVVRQLRQQDGLHSELSATCSGQGHVAEHNTEDASTVYVACTPRLSSESVQACLPPGCELPPASHALPGNPFTHQVVDLYLAHFAWDTVSLRFEAYGAVADDERQVVDHSLVEAYALDFPGDKELSSRKLSLSDRVRMLLTTWLTNGDCYIYFGQ